MPQASSHRVPTRTPPTAKAKHGHDGGSAEGTRKPGGSRASVQRSKSAPPRPARAEGVDVADVGDALSNALRASAETAMWIVTTLFTATRTAATHSARAIAVAWPALTHVLPRGAWWGALVLLFFSGTVLLDAFAPAERLAWIPGTFVVGLALASVPAFLARAPHLRAFGVALAAAHASALLLVWMVEAG